MTHSPSTSAAASGVDERLRGYLAQGRWRKARDELKPLVKQDRGRYLPLLIEANVGLAREMMAKGQVSEAQQVVGYLATMAPAAQVRSLELELATRRGGPPVAFGAWVRALAEGNTAMTEEERMRLADLVVLQLDSAPAALPSPPEAQAVHEALAAVSASQADHAMQSLRRIPHRSPFSHWAVFVKGLVAFHRADYERAEQCFRRLPRGSAPAKTSEAYRLLSGRCEWAGRREPVAAPVLEAACAITRQPHLAAILGRAEQLWRQGRHVESYGAVRDAVRGFPALGLDLLGLLTEFYFNAPHRMAVADREAYLAGFDRLIARRAWKNPAEEMLARRVFALGEARRMPSCGLRDDWLGFLRLYDAHHGANPRRTSLAYGWLGKQLAQPQPSRYGFFPDQRRLGDANGAIELLRQSVELDPANLEAHLTLCDVYEALRQKSERNRLLDTMTTRFPDDKRVLLTAAQACVERRALLKGLEYLARARELDPLDPATPSLIASTQERLAQTYFQQGQREKGCRAWAAVEALWVDRPEDLVRSRWTVLIRRGLTERLWGDLRQGEAFLAQARDCAPCLEAWLAFAHLAHRAYAAKRGDPSPFGPDLQGRLRAGVTVGQLLWVVRVLDHWRSAPEAPALEDEEGWTQAVFGAALRRPFSRTEAVELTSRLEARPRFEPQARALVKQVLRQDPADPLFRLCQLGLAEEEWYSPERRRAELQSILEEALRRRDDSTACRARQLLQNLLRELEDRPFELEEPAGPDRDGDAEIDGSEAAGPGELAEVPPHLAAFAQLVALLRTASEATIAELRRTRLDYIPEALLEELIRVARGEQPGAPRPPESGGSPDLRQMELF